MVSGPLEGVRILDLTHVWAGPLAVRFLADMGAAVVKVEAPYGRGPMEYPSQPIGGWLGGEPGTEPWNLNAIFNKLHRNRRSLCIDLKQESGRQTLLDLVGVADILIENFSARAMPTMGLDYSTLKAVNPKIIYVTMSGYGRSGPYRDRVAFGPTVEVMSGLTAMLGYNTASPCNSAIALMDPIAATHAVSAVVTALRQREQKGIGALVEMSLHEAGVAYSGPWLLDKQLGADPQCIGNRHPGIAPHGVYPCAGEDAWLALSCVDEQQWQHLCDLLDMPFSELDLAQRQTPEYAAEIDKNISHWSSRFNKQEAAERLQAIGIAAGPVNTTPDMMADSQFKFREFFVPYEAFATPIPGNPIHIQGLNARQWSICPKLGADNHTVLQDGSTIVMPRSRT